MSCGSILAYSGLRQFLVEAYETSRKPNSEAPVNPHGQSIVKNAAAATPAAISNVSPRTAVRTDKVRERVEVWLAHRYRSKSVPCTIAMTVPVGQIIGRASLRVGVEESLPLDAHPLPRTRGR